MRKVLKGKLKNLKNRLTKKKIRDKGGSKHCIICRRPAIANGYCEIHI